MKTTLIFTGITLGGWKSFDRGDSFIPYGLAYISA